MVENDRLVSNKNFLGKYIDAEGYVRRMSKDHPRADRIGYVLEHILVFEKTYDCCVLNWGIIHHKDHDKRNNVWYNLQGMTRANHTILHWTGKKHSNETIKKMTNRVFTDEHRRNISKSAKGLRLGKKHSIETRIKISEGNRGKKLSDETKEKISKSHKGKHYIKRKKVIILS